MAVFLITYDLKNPGQDYSGVLKTIKSVPWTQLSESSYAIDTTSSVEEVKKVLRSFMDANDTLYIITLCRPYSGHGPKTTNDWLEEHLPR